MEMVSPKFLRPPEPLPALTFTPTTSLSFIRPFTPIEIE
jgi:hypothetical protein